MSRCLNRLRDAGADVVLISPPGAYGPRLSALGFRWIPLPMNRRSLNPIREAGLMKTLTALYRKERPDLAHHFTVKCVIYGSLAARAAGTRGCVNAIAGMGYVFSSGSALARALRPLLKWVFRIVLRGDRTRLIVQNPDDRRVFVKQGLIESERVYLIRGSGVDVNRFRPRTQSEDGRQAPIRVLLATRLLWDKGVAEFVEAARLLRAEGVPTEFLVAGTPDKGNPAAVPLDYVERCAAEGLIKPLGHVEAMENLLADVDLVVLPTTYGEGVPRILLEAAASGLAIVATDVPGCREIVDHGVTGLLIEPKSPSALARAIKRLAEHAEERLAMGRAGRMKALAEFDERIVIERTLDVYRDLIGHSELPVSSSDVVVSRADVAAAVD